MSTLHPISGEKIYIGGVLSDQAADFAAADFTSQSWTLIDGWKTAGKLGDTANLITTQIINRGRDIKQKGTKNAGSMANNFAVLTNDPGQILLIAAAQTTNNYAFRLVGTDAAAARSAVVTVTIAAPGVFTDALHGMSIGDQVSFSTTGALPTGLLPATTYFVVAAGFTTGAYSVGATSGGSAITTTGTQSGVHTRSTVPTSSERKFIALVMEAADVGGTANVIAELQSTLEVNSNVVNIAATGS
jgi:hypothetical protein